MGWQSKRVAVTGAGGFIGSHLAEALVRAGAKVTAVVRYNARGDDGNLRHVPRDVRGGMNVQRLDLADLDAARRALKDAEIIFNLAAFVGIPYSYVNPADTVLNNMHSTVNVLSVARDSGAERVVQTSTSEVYGSALQIPIPETHPLQPQSPYSASKIATDNVSLSYYYSFRLPVAIVRPFNTFGPRQSARAVIPAVITQALSGQDVRVGTTTTTRDFTFVDDTVRGFLLAGASDAAVGQVINIGTGGEHSIDETIRRIVALAGRSVKVVQDEQRIRPEASEVSRLCADITKARKLLGYQPGITLDEGLTRTIAWIGEHLDEYRPEAYAV